MIEKANRLQNVSTYYFAQKLAEIAQMNNEGETVINLGIGSPDLKPDRSVIFELSRASLEKEANKYQSYRGIPELRSAFANWYSEHFDTALDANQEILPLAGSKEGIMHIAMSFLNSGDEVLVPNPGYPAYRMTANLAGATVRYFDLKEEHNWLPDLEALAQSDLSKVKLMWINYPNMPTGAKASRSFFESLIAFGKQHNILICHDNPYLFILNDEPLSIMQFDGAKDTCLELTSLSKCYNMAGWRVGALAANSEVIDTILQFKSNMDSGMYKPVQKAAAQALTLGKEWFAQLNSTYQERRKIALRILDELDCSYSEDSAGLFVWAKMNSASSSAEFIDQILQKARVFIAPGHIFGSNGEGFVRISLCNDVAILEEALTKIKALKH